MSYSSSDPQSGIILRHVTSAESVTITTKAVRLVRVVIGKKAIGNALLTILAGGLTGMVVSIVNLGTPTGAVLEYDIPMPDGISYTTTGSGFSVTLVVET